MNTIKVNLSDASAVLQLGRRGENEVSEVIFDYADWVEEFGPGVVSLLVRRSRDASAYPVTLTSGEGNTVTWLVSATDTQYVGGGRAELVYTVDEQIAKSVVYKTSVLQDIGEPSTTPPDPYETWVDTLTALGATVEGYAQDAAESATAAEEAVAHYPKIENDYWYVWDTEADDFVNTGIKAEGEDGFSPTVTIAEIPGGHRVTITDAEGDHTFDVMDGTVNSVNGKTGTVVLDASDVGALPSNTTYVSSVNGSSGAVTVTVPTKTSDLQNDSGFITSAPVTSVNSKTGAVTLTASDVGAGTYSKPSGGIPSSDMSTTVQSLLGKASTAYQMPSGGIPASDLASAVQTSLGKADTALQPGDVTEPLVVMYSASSISQGGTTCDKTYNEITAAAMGGQQIVALLIYHSQPLGIFSTVVVDNTTGALCFTGIVKSSFGLGCWSVTHATDDKCVTSITFLNGGGGEAVESVNGKIGTVILAASDVGAVDADQGVVNAGKFLVVDSNGLVTPTSMDEWQGGNY